MSKDKSPYKEGDVYWAFILEGSHPNYTESLVKIKFSNYTNGWSHCANVLSGPDNTNGNVYIDFTIHDDRIDRTQLFDSYSEAKEHLIKYLELMKERAIEKADNELNYKLSRIEGWEEFHKDVLRESKIDDILSNEH